MLDASQSGSTRVMCPFPRPPLQGLQNGLQGKPMVHRKLRQLRAGGNPEFVENMAKVELYRILSELDVLGDFPVAITRDTPRDNLQFSRRQPEVFLFLVHTPHEVAQALHQIRDSVPPHPILPGHHGMNALESHSASGTREHNASRSQL